MANSTLVPSFFDKNYVIFPPCIPNHGLSFVDHSKNSLSGHLGHALFQARSGELTAFYPVCSGDNGGHSAIGWMAFRRSVDLGRTWSEPEDFFLSKQAYDRHDGATIMCEKAVTCDDGTIVLFTLTCDVSKNPLWEPYLFPHYVRSFDDGRTWTAPVRLGEERGRVYDALYRDGTIYVLKFANSAEENWTGCHLEHVYELYSSTDNGATFVRKSIIPLDTQGRGYGTMEFTKAGCLMVGVYNIADENTMDIISSDDCGVVWSQAQGVWLEKRIRNPQLVRFGNGYMLHGRSGNEGPNPGNFVLYSSEDALQWDEGRYLCTLEAGFGEYSNNLVVRDPCTNHQRLLIQSSHAYRENLTNILQWWIDLR
jgi:hypothetical protein